MRVCLFFSRYSGPLSSRTVPLPPPSVSSSSADERGQHGRRRRLRAQSFSYSKHGSGGDHHHRASSSALRGHAPPWHGASRIIDKHRTKPAAAAFRRGNSSDRDSNAHTSSEHQEEEELISSSWQSSRTSQSRATQHALSALRFASDHHHDDSSSSVKHFQNLYDNANKSRHASTTHKQVPMNMNSIDNKLFSQHQDMHGMRAAAPGAATVGSVPGAGSDSSSAATLSALTAFNLRPGAEHFTPRVPHARLPVAAPPSRPTSAIGGVGHHHFDVLRESPGGGAVSPSLPLYGLSMPFPATVPSPFLMAQHKAVVGANANGVAAHPDGDKAE